MIHGVFRYGLHTVLIRFSYGFHTVFIRCSYGVHTVFIRYSYGFHTVFIRFSYGLQMHGSCSFRMILLRFSFGLRTSMFHSFGIWVKYGSNPCGVFGPKIACHSPLGGEATEKLQRIHHERRSEPGERGCWGGCLAGCGHAPGNFILVWGQET